MPVTSLFQALHELIQQDHFATGDNKPVHRVQVIFTPSVVLLSTLKQEGVVTALLQLCYDIQQRHLPTFATLQACACS